MRVFGLSGFVGIPYGHLPVRTRTSVWVHGHTIVLSAPKKVNIHSTSHRIPASGPTNFQIR